MSGSDSILSLPRPIIFTYVLSILYNVTFFIQFVTMPYLIKSLGISDSDNGIYWNSTRDTFQRTPSNNIWTDSSRGRTNFWLHHPEIWYSFCPLSLLRFHIGFRDLALLSTGFPPFFRHRNLSRILIRFFWVVWPFFSCMGSKAIKLSCRL